MIGALISLVLLAPPPPAENDPDPYGGAATWNTPPPGEQSTNDATIAPAATGAIYVPIMTDSLLEPDYIVRRKDAEIAVTPMGTKTWVQPGTYRVLVGRGVPANRLEFEVDVVEGETTFVPVEWTGLIVNVVNERGTPFRGTYELVRMPEREYVGLGLGANVAEGEEVTTWIVAPGRYMLLSAGESYRARKNFATLRLPPGELLTYTLVLDESNGDILGAGEISDDTQSTLAGPWDLSLLVGGSLAFNKADSVVGKSDGMTLDVSAYIEALGGYREGRHFAYARLYIEEEGSLSLPDALYSTTVDTLDLDLLYMWRWVRWFGPYARVSFDTQMVPGVQKFDTPTTVVKQDNAGVAESVAADILDIELTPPFSPLDFRYGAGGRFDLKPAYFFNMSARLGLGARHLFTRGLFVKNDDSDTSEFEVRRATDLTQFGAEASLITEARITRWVQLKFELDLLAPFDDFERPVIDLRGTISLRLASFAALSYTLRVIEDPGLQDDTQVDHTLLLRFAYKIL
jgi:hypothetical protein